MILDTHVWLWLNEGSSELKKKIISLIDEAAQTDGIYISAISVWEVAMLASKKRIILRTSIEDWIKKALAQPGVELIPLLPEIAIESAHLPEDPHGDSADRMIMATARIKQLTLLTRDANILAYSKKGYLKAIQS